MRTATIKIIKKKGIAFIPLVIGALLIGGTVGLVGWLTGLPLAEKIGWFIFGLFFAIIGSISLSFSSLAATIFQWVISPDFVSLSYTNPANNPIIEAGLSITQGFANMILVIILVFIALSIILRVERYEIKNLLPSFILIALLVNFSPVIVGVVVDAANILMNYFFQNIQGATGVGWINELFALLESVENIFGGDISTTRANFFYVFTISIFAIATGIVYLIYSLIIMVRYVVIWALTILSPLAFIAYILPITRNLFKKWWSQLVQWSFVGVTTGFFIYLGAHTTSRAKEIFKVEAINNPNLTPISTLLVYMVPLLFLYLGVLLGTQTSAMGAKSLIDLATKGVKAVGKTYGKKMGRYIYEKGGIREKVGRLLRGKPEEERRTGIRGILDKGLLDVPGLRVLIPEAVKKFPERRIKINEAMKELDDFSSIELGRQIKSGELYGSRKVAALKILAGRGDFQDFWSPFTKQYASEIAGLRKIHPEIATDEAALGYSLSDEEKKRFKGINAFQQKTAQSLQLALQNGYHNDLIRSDPRLAMIAFGRIKGFMPSDLTASGFSGNTEGAIAKAVAEARQPHIVRWEREVLEDKAVVQELLKKERSVFESLIPAIKRGRETMLQTFKKILEDFAAGEQLDTEEKIEKAWSGFIADPQRKKSYAAFINYVNTDRAIQQGWSRKTGHQRLITGPDGKQRREDIIIPNFLGSSSPPKSQSPESQPPQQTTPRQRPPSVAGYTPPRQPPKITRRGFFGHFFPK